MALAELIALVVSQPVLASSVVVGFLTGAVSLVLVNRQVAEIGRKLDRQDERLRLVEGTVDRIEERWRSESQ